MQICSRRVAISIVVNYGCLRKFRFSYPLTGNAVHLEPSEIPKKIRIYLSVIAVYFLSCFT